MASNRDKIYTSHVLKFVTTTATLGVGASTNLDSNNNVMLLPRGFVIDDGYLHSTDGTATGTISLGINGGDEDSLVSALDNSTGSGAAARFAITNVSNALTGVGLANQGDVANTLIITQNTAAEAGSPVVTIYVLGHYEFDA